MRALGASVKRSERAEDRVTIEFASDYDHGLLEETLAVERACCPFFRFDLDARARRLTVSVDGPDHQAGLKALAYALGISPAGP
jgi:hypothetical protein